MNHILFPGKDSKQLRQVLRDKLEKVSISSYEMGEAEERLQNLDSLPVTSPFGRLQYGSSDFPV